ncbi:MAG: hypothetical protein Q8N47_12290 [Bryobacterales bacterium]|nr:hypothetical protein [Bryobacterales bacterium]
MQAGYTGLATPSLSRYTFTPSSRAYTNVLGNRTREDYAGGTSTAYPIFTTGPIPDDCGVPSQASQFPAATTARIYGWIPVQGNQGDPYYWDWYDPSQNRWQRSSGTLSFTGTGCAWSWVDVAGTDAANRPGTWRVEFWFNNTLNNANSFQLTGGVGGNLTVSGSVQTPYIVLPGSHGLAGVTVSFSNGPTAVTDDNGNYTATVPFGYSGTATPSFPGYFGFSPPNRSYTNVTSNISGQDYTATLTEQLRASPNSFTFASQAGATPASQTLAVSSTGANLNFTVAVSNGAPWLSVSPSQGTTPSNLTVTANPAGLAAGTYTVQIIISAGDIRYRPAPTISVSLVVSTPTYVSVSGAVRTSSGQGIPAVAVAFSNGGPTVSSDSNGNYSASILPGYSGTATPLLNGYVFDPSSRSYSSLSSNRSGEDYTGQPPQSYPIFTTGPIADGCAPPTASTQFTTATTSRIYAWLPVQGNQSDPLRWDWYDPSENRYSRSTGSLSFSGKGCAWSWIDVSGTNAASLPGTWRVEYWQSSSLQNSNTFQLVVTSSTPTITAITHAASSAVGPVAPGELITTYGTNLGLPTLTSLKVAANGLVDTTLAGTRVLFDGVAAPLLYAWNDQVGAIVPYSVAGKQSTKLQVEFRGTQSATVDLRVVDSNPGIFTVNQQGSGQGAVLNQNNSVNGPSSPADKNSVVVIYATGEGQTSPAGVDGTITGTLLRKPTAPVSVMIGGQTAEVLYAGAAPGIVSGVMQVNARVPANIAGGDSVPIVLKVGNSPSPSGVTMAVRQQQANLAFEFSPNPVSRSSDGFWRYSLTDLPPSDLS